MLCKACREPLNVGAPFCPHCGVRRSNVEGAKVPPPPAPFPPLQQVAIEPPPSRPGSPSEQRDLQTNRLLKARIGVSVGCLILGIALYESLTPIAGVLAVAALLMFAGNWSIPTISYKRKIVLVVVSLALIVGAESIEISIRRARDVERQKHLAQIDAQRESQSREASEQAEDTFRRMTPAQHLSTAQADLRLGAPEDQIAEGMKHLNALSGTPMEAQAQALGARYQAEKGKADKAAAARAAALAAKQERENVADLEEARKAYAKTLEKSLLDQDMDATVEAIGPQHTTLRITWVLATKLFAYKIAQQEQEGFEDMRELGFKKFIVFDGYDRSWTWGL